jgi:hypothetical protein
MKHQIVVALATVAVLSLFAGVSGTFGASCVYDLNPAKGQPGSAEVSIVDNTLSIAFRRANPDTLYTIWVDHRNRATGKLAPDYPLAQGALPRGVAPAFATTEGVTSGMGLDRNAVITDSLGDADVTISLDYGLLEQGDSPVVGEQLAMQGKNRVGGGWLRMYPIDPTLQASLQVTDPTTGLPLVQRSTAQGITIVVHPDFVSHGHTPGVGGVDHFSAFSGDFPSACPTDGVSISLDNTSNASRKTSTLSWPHTVGGGADRVLMVGTSHRDGNKHVTGISYGGAPLTNLGVQNGPGNQNRVELWYLIAPAPGTANVVVTLSDARNIVGGAASYIGVDQITPFGAFVSASNQTQNATITVTSQVDELIMDVIAANGDAKSLTVGAGQTSLWNTGTGTAGGDIQAGANNTPGASLVTFSWTLGKRKPWAIGAVTLKPANVP